MIDVCLRAPTCPLRQVGGTGRGGGGARPAVNLSALLRALRDLGKRPELALRAPLRPSVLILLNPLAFLVPGDLDGLEDLLIDRMRRVRLEAGEGFDERPQGGEAQRERVRFRVGLVEGEGDVFGIEPAEGHGKWQSGRVAE